MTWRTALPYSRSLSAGARSRCGRRQSRRATRRASHPPPASVSWPSKCLREERRRAARDVHVLAHEVAVHPRDEVVGVELEVLDPVVELGGDVVAQPLRIHPELEVALRADAGAARLRHLLARRHDEEAVDEHVGRRLALREAQHRRPEQRVEVDDVLADEVILLDVGRGHELVEAARFGRVRAAGGAGIEVLLERRQIADRRVEPDVEVFARRVRDLDAEVRRIARDVPVVERLARLRRAIPGSC